MNMFKNRIINGAMVIDQRNAGASVTVTNTEAYTLDRWKALSSPTSKFSIQQNAGSVTPPVGYNNYLGATSLSAYSASSGDWMSFHQAIEGYNVADLAWGTANAASVTLSFWARSSLTGTFSGTVRNDAANRSYPFTFAIASANTWTFCSVVVPGDTSGTWLKTSGAGLWVFFNMGSGSSNLGTAGSWASANLVGATGSVSVVGTNGATFYITGVQLEKGSTATSFDYRPYGTELQLCQRYYELGGIAFTNQGVISGSFQVAKRATPTMTRLGNIYSGSEGGSFAAFNQFAFYVTTASATYIGGSWSAASEL
jgi:hypothetical protein